MIIYILSKAKKQTDFDTLDDYIDYTEIGYFSSMDNLEHYLYMQNSHINEKETLINGDEPINIWIMREQELDTLINEELNYPI